MDVHLLYKKLKKRFPERVVTEPQDPFKVLIFTIISQRTRDEQTKEASEKLLAKFPTPKDIARARVKDIENLIRPAGFYRVKARKIKEVCKILIEEYNGKVPDDFDSLISLPSVGRKTANCVLVFGFMKAAIPVDTHVHRISNRLGLVDTEKPEETEEALKDVLPEKYWIDINHILVRFGQVICRPVNPKCEICPVSGLCKWYKESN